MKVILTGSTGFIGGEILRQALENPNITSLVCLTRKVLPETATKNPKVKIVMMNNFTTYTPDVMPELDGACCCIWALGSPARKNANLEDCRNIEIGYTSAAAEAFGNRLAPTMTKQGRTFRFVYLSGKFSEQDTDKQLWFLHDSRTIKASTKALGQAENGLLAVQENIPGFEVSIMRPGGVLARKTLVPNILVGPTFSIKVDELAAAMIAEALENVKGTRTWECDALRRRGNLILKHA